MVSIINFAFLDTSKLCSLALWLLLTYSQVLETNMVHGAKSSLGLPKRNLNQSQTSIEFQHALSDGLNLSNSKVLKRDKRYLIFGGISKLVLGFLAPVETRDNVNWRTLNLAYNIQAQYQALPRIVWPWDKFSRSLDDQRKKYDADGTFAQDGTRQFVYKALEIFMDRKVKNGKECLLKAICEAAVHPIHRGGVFDEVVHLVLTPNKKEVDDDYVDARSAGLFGADCSDLYSKCPAGEGLLDKITFYF